MGHEVRLQTVPLDHPLVREWFEPTSGHDPGEEIQNMFFRFGEMRRGMNPESFLANDTPASQVKKRKVVSLAQQYPWLLCGFVDLDRKYDYVIWMLERWCANEEGCEALARAAVLGSQQIAGSATASQGRPINFSTAEQADEIYRFLKRIEQRTEFPDLAFDQIPEERYIYKRCSAESLRDQDRRRELEIEISNLLRALLKFYQAARQTEFGVISLRD